MNKKTPQRIALLERQIEVVTGTPLHRIRSRSRRTDIIRPRHALWYLLRFTLGYPCGYVAKLYKRDHSTVSEATNKMAWEKDYIDELKQKIEKRSKTALQPLTEKEKAAL